MPRAAGNQSRVSKTQISKQRTSPSELETREDLLSLVSTPNLSDETFFSRIRYINCTDRYILFYHGILSNWYLNSPDYSGLRALELSVEELRKILDQKQGLPNLNSFATWLLTDHKYNCGEQWMMATKAWVFEGSLGLWEDIQPDVPNMADNEDKNGTNSGRLHWESATTTAYQEFKDRIFNQDYKDIPKQRKKLVEDWRKTGLFQILSASSPKEQKALGRGLANFDPAAWDTICVPLVTASCVSRAEVDPILQAVYARSKARKFAEGSPRDTVWGIGLGYQSEAAKNEKNWRGQNKLGVCHNKARDYLVSKL